MILAPLSLARLKISFWLTQEFFTCDQNTSVLKHELLTFFSHSIALSPHYQIWFMKSASMVKCVDVRGEIYISSFPPSKMSFYFVSVSHSGTPLTRDLKEDDSTKAEDADQKTGWSFMNTSCNCRCSFKNRSTLIIARLFKVFTFYFWGKK